MEKKLWITRPTPTQLDYIPKKHFLLDKKIDFRYKLNILIKLVYISKKHFPTLF